MADEQSLNTDLLLLPPNTFNAMVREAVLAGMPLCCSTVASDDGPYEKANAGVVGFTGRNARVVGLATQGAAARDRVHAQYSGLLKLTTAQWDAITGGSGGLTRGDAYYVSATTSGHLTTTAPSGGGQFVSPVGIATSATTMRLVQPVAKSL